MLLEVSATPKPGNVDRDHDYKDTKYEHFLASAVGCYPVFRKAAESSSGVGKLILDAVSASRSFHRGGNTHFGTLILLIPLLMGAGKAKCYEDIRKNSTKIVKKTTISDAVNLYRAFQKCRVRVRKVRELDVYDPSSIDEIKRRGITLYQLMESASSRDLIAREWTSGFHLTFSLAEELGKWGEINEKIVRAYLKFLSENLDTFVETKAGKRRAKKLMREASAVLKSFSMEEVERFDERLIVEKINPGSSADILCCAIFLFIVGGERF
jgi:triphosphoribosyl-dephospho-CoA synthase